MKNFVKEIIKNVLKNLVKRVLQNHKPIIIGITGTIAKTSTKEVLWQVLNKRFAGKVKKSEGNLNNEIGLPLAILGFNKSPRWYQWPSTLLIAALRASIDSINPLSQISILILEYAADKPGDIKYLTSIARPNIAVITAIGPAHMANYQSFDQLVEEKAQLVYALKKYDIAILNKKDANIKKIIPHVLAEIKYFNADLDDIIEHIARKIAEIFHINQKLVTNVLQNISQVEHRMNIIELRDITIIDDTYNANPLSMEYALGKLKTQNSKLKTKRRIAVIGNMLELGKNSAKYHQEVGKLAKKSADLVIGIGELAKNYQADQWFTDIVAAEKFLLENIQKGDIILFKASRGMRLEKLVEEVVTELK